MNRVIHIAPQLPPAIDGVGDYCWNLWKYWPEPQPSWTFLVTRGAAETVIVWREIDAHEFDLDARSLHAALEESGRATAVLHYVGYGYQPKGAPLWLPGAFENWKRADPRRRLVVMFHEMYARSSPLRSPFWVAPFARRIIRQLVRLSDAWVTSCARYFAQLQSEFEADPARGCIIPIGSNIPSVWAHEAGPAPSRETKRGFRLVVFGLARTRLWALNKHRRLLAALAQAGMLAEVTLLGKHPGPDDEAAWQRFARALPGNIHWRKRFDLAGGDISHELAGHDFGLLANEPDILTKSGVFAALAAHGVLPFVAAREKQTIPTTFADAVLISHETDSSLAGTVKFLQSTAAVRSAQEKLVALAESQLAWPRITQSWSHVLGDETPDRDTPQPGADLPIGAPIGIGSA